MKELHLQMILHQILHLSMQQSMRLLEEFDLKPGQAGILFVLNSQGGISQKDLAKKVELTPPSITVAIRKMDDQGYITRSTDEKDQRIIRLEVTDKGRSCIIKINGVLDKMEAILFDNMSVEEKILFKRLLYQMRDNLTSCKELEGVKLCPPMH